MKTLLLLRHGKSSWDDPELEDHDRPLKPRGRKFARRTGRWLRDSGLKIDRVLCSTAVRARETWEVVAEQLARIPPVDFRDDLYHCPLDRFAQVLHEAPAKSRSVMIVGHNPGLEDLLAKLRGVQESFPTGALAQLTCPIKSWSEFETDLPCTLESLIRPREIQ
jgi:phosphohistidine phosphatase